MAGYESLITVLATLIMILTITWIVVKIEDIQDKTDGIFYEIDMLDEFILWLFRMYK